MKVIIPRFNTEAVKVVNDTGSNILEAMERTTENAKPVYTTLEVNAVEIPNANVPIELVEGVKAYKINADLN